MQCISSTGADEKAMKILLSGATLWKESDGFKIYTKPGNELDAQVDWFLIEPKGVIYHVSLTFRRTQGT